MSQYELDHQLMTDDNLKELKQRYRSMLNIFSDILNCGIWDIEEMFDSSNNIEVGEIIKNYVDEFGQLPDWNTVYREAMLNFAAKHDLEPGVDVDIYTNACLDTHIYAREGLDEDIIKEMEELFGMNAETLA